jgi:hypothetical protein
MNKTKLVPLDMVRDNPWRDRVRNPIDADRVEAIAVSIGKTKYWMGTYGRELPDGTVQLAFGHHRVEGAKAQGLKEIPIIIEDFTDGEMLVWMAQENVRGELPVVLEAVFAAVRALGEGKIEVESLSPKSKISAIRYAPSFIAGACCPTVGQHPYTTDSIARFLGYTKKSTGRPKDSVTAAFGILETAERAGMEGGETGKKKASAVEKSLAKLPVNEAVKAVSEIKQREVKIAERQEEVKKANLADAEKMRELQAQTEAREAAAWAVRQAELAKLKAAREAEDKAESDRIFLKMKAQGEAQIAKALADKGKLEALEAKVEERKHKEEEARNQDVYAPTLREVERILGKLHGTTSTSKEALAEEVKALARKALKPNDRERLRQAALLMGTWYNEFVATQFLPPLTKRRTK